jgi:hypothetical protein
MLLEKKSECGAEQGNKFGIPPPTRIRVAGLRDKFGANVTVGCMNKERSEDLAVQRTTQVFRQCYRASQNL